MEEMNSPMRHPPARTSAPTATELADLCDIIVRNEKTLATKTSTAGFDGFVDTIVRIIRSKEPGLPHTFFTTTSEFGAYIVGKGGTSFGLEVEERKIKLGGNMPIMAHALGTFGVHVNCIGALGYPEIHPVFKNISSNCHVYSFAGPGASTAFEFNDGKIMFAQMGELNSFGWEKIKQAVGLNTLLKLYESSDLLCVVNWSEIDMSSDIWKGVLKDIFPCYDTQSRNQTALFDLSDFSKRSPEAIREALGLIREFSVHARVTLSLNKNETRNIFELLYHQPPVDDFFEMGTQMFERLGVEILLLHSPKEAIAIDHNGVFSSPTFFVEQPKISTGAGDHFNAGFSAARLLKMDLRRSLVFANAVSASYVKTGVSPHLSEVAAFLSQK
jgi:sugar/nucleoside kinase (ribokinase family)